MGNARSGNQQISFGMLDIATSSSLDRFEITALGHGGRVLAQVVLTTAGKSALVGDEIKASGLALVDTGAAGRRQNERLGHHRNERSHHLHGWKRCRLPSPCGSGGARGSVPANNL